MDDSNSELTKISMLPKRVLLPIEDQQTFRTLDNNLSEISDITELLPSHTTLLAVNNSYRNLNNTEEPDIKPDKTNEVTDETVKQSSNMEDDVPVPDMKQKSQVENELPTLKVEKTASSICDPNPVEATKSSNQQTIEYQNIETTNVMENGELAKITDNVMPTKEKQEPEEEIDINLLVEIEAIKFANKQSKIKYDISKFEADLLKANLEEVSSANADLDISTRNSEAGSKILKIFELNYAPVTSITEEETEETKLFAEKISERQRSKLLSSIETVVIEQQSLEKVNQNYQKLLVEYFRRRKPDAASKIQQELEQKETLILDKEQRYAKLLMSIHKLQVSIQQSLETYAVNDQINLKQKENIDRNLEAQWSEFLHFREEFAVRAANSHTGKKIPSEEWHNMLQQEQKKDVTVHFVRLESLKRQTEVKKLMDILNAKENLGQNLSMIDFEQYKIENQAYNEKLEERKETIRRLNEKICSNIHKLSHTKEKLRWESRVFKSETTSQKLVVKDLNWGRVRLTKLKKHRDEIVNSNQRIFRSSGLLNKRDLLRHFEDTTESMERQKKLMESLESEQRLLQRHSKTLNVTYNETKLVFS